MKIKTIKASMEITLPTGNYANIKPRVELEAEVAGNEDAQDVYEALDKELRRALVTMLLPFMKARLESIPVIKRDGWLAESLTVKQFNLILPECAGLLREEQPIEPS